MPATGSHAQPRPPLRLGRPDNDKLVAWDQSVRYLPVEVRVTAGMSLALFAKHDESQTQIGVLHGPTHPPTARNTVHNAAIPSTLASDSGLPELHPSMVTDIGHPEVISAIPAE